MHPEGHRRRKQREANPIIDDIVTAARKCSIGWSWPPLRAPLGYPNRSRWPSQAAVRADFPAPASSLPSAD